MTVYGGKKITEDILRLIKEYMNYEILDAIERLNGPCEPERVIEEYLEEDAPFIHVLEDQFEFDADDEPPSKYAVVHESDNGSWMLWGGDELKEAQRVADEFDCIHMRDHNEGKIILVNYEEYFIDNEYEEIPYYSSFLNGPEWLKKI